MKHVKKYCGKHKRTELRSEKFGEFCEECGIICVNCVVIKWYCPRCRDASEKVEETKHRKKKVMEKKHFYRTLKKSRVKIGTTNKDLLMITKP